MACAIAVTAAGCGTGQSASTAVTTRIGAPVLGVDQIVRLIPAGVEDLRAWSEAIANALAANQLNSDKQAACAVIAVIAQESGFAADPVVPGLAKIVATRIDHYKDKLGPLGDPLFKRLLAGRAPDDARTFEERIAHVRTERDVDLLFRDILAYYEVNHPAMFTALNWAGKLVDVDSLAELNPVTTAGSMQVSVRFAAQWAQARKGATATAESVREALYTRTGGVYYGTARLLVYPVRYQQQILRFADYNAGLYASRNAAVQAQLAQLTGRKLALDGDLLAYEKNGTPKDDETESMRAVHAFAQQFVPDLAPGQIRSDLLLEKTLAFEDTATYRALKQVATQRSRGPVDYAILPQVSISSPKFTRSRSTAWFAQSVDRRYQSCLAADGAAP